MTKPLSRERPEWRVCHSGCCDPCMQCAAEVESIIDSYLALRSKVRELIYWALVEGPTRIKILRELEAMVSEPCEQLTEGKSDEE